MGDEFFIAIIIVILLLIISDMNKPSGSYVYEGLKKARKAVGGATARNAVASDKKRPAVAPPGKALGLAKRQGMSAASSSPDSYNEFIKKASLESSVFDSQRAYNNEMAFNTTSASTLSVRDDPNDLVPRVGFRRSYYQDGVGSRPDENDSRSLPTEESKHVSHGSRYVI